MASRTTAGFCDVEAESRYTSGRPLIRRSRIGKSRRTTCGSKPTDAGASAPGEVDEVEGVASIAIERSCPLAGSLHRLGLGAGRRLRHEKRLVWRVGRETGLAEDRAVALVLETKCEVFATALDDPSLGQDVDLVRGDVVEEPL